MYDQAHLKKKVPAIQETLDMLAFLKKKAVRQPPNQKQAHNSRAMPDNPFWLCLLVTQDEEEVVDTHFNLSDNVYAKATISNSDRVYLWLGVSAWGQLRTHARTLTLRC